MTLQPVQLDNSWEQILGKNRGDMTDSQRRDRWNDWKKIAKSENLDEWIDFWTDSQECVGCKHHDNDWCQLCQLPCTVNPVLTYKHNMMGMACAGLGRESEPPKQLTLW
ncbi:hypothetical protein EZY14_016365 [Kordia sp. TARA_039_SRF]|nr:hypothetical protein EZY14_016365 [Kordia sp. TARA_039_SRF]